MGQTNTLDLSVYYPCPISSVFPPSLLLHSSLLPYDIQILPLSDPDNSSFWNIFLGRITTVFSLVLPSYDQSIAQEMGSSESCLSKISCFTSWSILREHSAPSLPEGKYFSYLCIKRQAEATHTSAVKENTPHFTHRPQTHPM